MWQQSRLFISTAALLAPILLSACDGSVRREGPPEVGLHVVRVDDARNRRWVLELDALTVYDNTNGRRLRRMILPDWVVAGPRDGCPPDLVIDRSGAAFVSSNVLPVVWRIGPQRFELTRIDLALDADADKDVGFTSLSLEGDGTLLAAGATFGSLWRIDLGTARAAKVASHASPGRCDPALVSGSYVTEHDEQRHVVSGLQHSAQD